MHLSTDQKGVAGGSRAREHEHLDLFLCEPMGFRSGACDGHRRSPIGSNRSPLYNPCNAMSLRTERLTGFPRFFDLGPLSSIAKGAFCRGSPRRPPRFAWPGAANDPFKLGLSRLNRQLNM